MLTGKLSCQVTGLVVINFLHKFQWIFFFKLYTQVGCILQMCMWLFDIDEIDFDRITAF